MKDCDIIFDLSVNGLRHKIYTLEPGTRIYGKYIVKCCDPFSMNYIIGCLGCDTMWNLSAYEILDLLHSVCPFCYAKASGVAKHVMEFDANKRLHPDTPENFERIFRGQNSTKILSENDKKKKISKSDNKSDSKELKRFRNLEIDEEAPKEQEDKSPPVKLKRFQKLEID